MFAHQRKKTQLLFAVADALLTALAFEAADGDHGRGSRADAGACRVLDRRIQSLAVAADKDGTAAGPAAGIQFGGICQRDLVAQNLVDAARAGAGRRRAAVAGDGLRPFVGAGCIPADW